MKLFKQISLLFLASVASASFVSCERDYDAPPLNVPEYDGPAANITINELRKMAASATEDAPFIIGDKGLVMKAIVSANDESGNIYKKIFLQDKDGAIEMEVDQNSVYNYYPVGQEVFVHLDSLCISIYGDEQQLGHPKGYNFRTPWVSFEKIVVKNGWADPQAIQPIEISDISTINSDVDFYKFKLLKFTGVAFVKEGKSVFVDSSEDKFSNRTIKDKKGNTLTIRTSSFAKFAGDKLPLGTGNVTGILGRFRGAWQLTLRTGADVEGFDGIDNEESPIAPSQETLLSESFGEDTKLGKFTIEDVQLPNGSDHVWSAANFKETYYAMASAFVNGANQNSDSRLVSPKLNLTGKSNVTLSFVHTFKTFGADTHKEDLKLEVREDGSETWQEVTIPNFSSGTDNKFVESGDINLSKFQGKTIQFAFHYKSNTENALRWQIQNVLVVAGKGGNGSESGTDINPTPSN